MHNAQMTNWDEKADNTYNNDDDDNSNRINSVTKCKLITCKF